MKPTRDVQCVRQLPLHGNPVLSTSAIWVAQSRASVQLVAGVDFMDINYVLSRRTNGANPIKIFNALPSLDQAKLRNQIKAMRYEDFLQTAYWLACATVVKANARMRCQVCNNAAGLTVHHRTYDAHGEEHKNLCDLTALCLLCHGLFHGHLPEMPQPFRERKIRERQPRQPREVQMGGHIVPHDPVTVPSEDPITLTRELLNDCRCNGAFTSATQCALGVPCRPEHGWVDRLIGTQISRADYIKAKEGKFHYNSKAYRVKALSQQKNSA